MTRLALFAAGACLLVGLGAGLCWYFLADQLAYLRAERKELQSQLQAAAAARVAERTLALDRAKKSAQRAQEQARRGDAAEAALRQHRAWADTSIPQEVRDALAE